MFSQTLISWYLDNGRDLPWRNTDNPYFIWLSEIIMQQTRVEQGRAYYHAFVTQYPTVADLAAASQEQVLKTWQGLGYYSRARNLHKAARYIVDELGGRFPSTYEGILKLSGVGRYTAAAIASFAFNLPHPVIDGNVYRFISRLQGIDTPIATDAAYKLFESRLLPLIDCERPGLFNQALMEFGALHCKPKNPDCAACPFASQCVALNQGRVDLLPVKAVSIKPKERYFYYFDIEWQQEGRTYRWVEQREGSDIWKGLYEFPLWELEKPLTEKSVVRELESHLQSLLGEAPQSLTIAGRLTHQLTHRTIVAVFVHVKYEAAPKAASQKWKAVSDAELNSLPISRLIDRYLSQK